MNRRSRADDNDDEDDLAAAVAGGLAADDPRRALGALQAAHGDDAVEVRQFVFEHRAALLGPLQDSDRFAATFDHGVIVELGFIVDGVGDEAAAIVEGLAAVSGLDFVRRVRLVGSARFDKVLRALMDAAPPRLRSLHTGPLRMGAGRQQIPLQEVLTAFPLLTTLRLEAPPAPWMPCAHAHLRHLGLSAMGVSELVGFATTSLPALSTLRLQTRGPADPLSLAAACRRADGSGLDFLGLIDVGLFDAWAAVSASGDAVAPKKLHLADIEKRKDVVPRVRLAGDEVIVTDRLDEVPAFDQAIYSPPAHRRRRRFEHDGQFFELWRDAATLGTRQGKIGKNGTTRSKTPGGSEYFVIEAYLQQLAAKRAAGFVEVFVADDAV